VHDSFIVPTAHEGALKEAMEEAFSCKNNPPKIPCKNSGQFGDKLSPGNPSGNPESVITMMERDRRVVGGWVEGLGLSLMEHVLEIVHGQLDETRAPACDVGAKKDEME